MTFHWNTDLIHKETGKVYRALVKDTAGEVVLFHSLESLKNRDHNWSPWNSDGGGMLWIELPYAPFTEESLKEWCAEMWEEAKSSHQWYIENRVIPAEKNYTPFQQIAKEGLQKLYPSSTYSGKNGPCVALDTPINDDSKEKILSYFPEDAVVTFYNSDDSEMIEDKWAYEEELANKYFGQI